MLSYYSRVTCGFYNSALLRVWPGPMFKNPSTDLFCYSFTVWIVRCLSRSVKCSSYAVLAVCYLDFSSPMCFCGTAAQGSLVFWFDFWLFAGCCMLIISSLGISFCDSSVSSRAR